MNQSANLVHGPNGMPSIREPQIQPTNKSGIPSQNITTNLLEIPNSHVADFLIGIQTQVLNDAINEQLYAYEDLNECVRKSDQFPNICIPMPAPLYISSQNRQQWKQIFQETMPEQFQNDINNLKEYSYLTKQEQIPTEQLYNKSQFLYNSPQSPHNVYHPSHHEPQLNANLAKPETKSFSSPTIPQFGHPQQNYTNKSSYYSNKQFNVPNYDISSPQYNQTYRQADYKQMSAPLHSNEHIEQKNITSPVYVQNMAPQFSSAKHDVSIEHINHQLNKEFAQFEIEPTQKLNNDFTKTTEATLHTVAPPTEFDFYDNFKVENTGVNSSSYDPHEIISYKSDERDSIGTAALQRQISLNEFPSYVSTTKQLPLDNGHVKSFRENFRANTVDRSNQQSTFSESGNLQQSASNLSNLSESNHYNNLMNKTNDSKKQDIPTHFTNTHIFNFNSDNGNNTVNKTERKDTKSLWKSAAERIQQAYFN